MVSDRERLLVDKLAKLLLREMPEFSYLEDLSDISYPKRRKLVRDLLTVRKPGVFHDDLSLLETELLLIERERRGFIDPLRSPSSLIDGIAVRKADIWDIKADIIVNRANASLLGCFIPNHKSIDSEVHAYAGSELRNYLFKATRGNEVPQGSVVLSPGFCLPSKTIAHAVPLTVRGRPTERDFKIVESMYRNILAISRERKAKVVAIPNLSGGENFFPAKDGAFLAIKAVASDLACHQDNPVVLFALKDEKEVELYERAIEEYLQTTPLFSC